MTSEIQFHKNRQAFVVFKDSVLLAHQGFEASHFDLLCQSGYTNAQALEIIETMPRGYFLSNDLYFYQGKDFLVLSEKNEKIALSFLDFFQKIGLFLSSSHIYSGMKKGEIGKRWLPIKEIKLSL